MALRAAPCRRPAVQPGAFSSNLSPSRGLRSHARPVGGPSQGAGPRRSGIRVPVEELGERVVRRSADVPARCAPALEVEMAALGVAGVADLADLLAGIDVRP